MAKWGRGTAEVDLLLSDGKLEEVPPSEDLAQQLLAEAEKQLARVQCERDALDSFSDGIEKMCRKRPRIAMVGTLTSLSSSSSSLPSMQ